MKRFGIIAALMLACIVTAQAEVVSKDTVTYAGEYRLEKVQKANQYGEVSVRYVAYLMDMTNAKGEPRKVPVDKRTYESGQITHIVYNNSDSGARKIAKAVNINTQKKEEKL